MVKPLLFRLQNVANYVSFSGKFLKFRKSAGVKVLTNIMSENRPDKATNLKCGTGEPPIFLVDKRQL